MVFHEDSIFGLMDSIGQLSTEILREIPPKTEPEIPITLNEGVEILYGKENVPSISKEVPRG